MASMPNVTDDRPAVEPPLAEERASSDSSPLELAHALARELAASAAERDHSGSAPRDALDLIRCAGLLALNADARAGGAGAGWPLALEVVRVIARADTSLAHLLGYHYAIAQSLWLYGTPEQALALTAVAVHEDAYWAAVDNPLDPELVLRAVGENFELSGRKTFATGAQLADRLIVSGTLDGTALIAAIPADREGVLAADDWDSFGQRATVSGSVELRGVQVSANELLGPTPGQPMPPSPYSTLVAPLTQSVLVNVFLGAAEGALEDALQYTRTTTRPWQGTGFASAVEDPYILRRYGELTAELRASIALADQSAAQLEQALAIGPQLDAQQRAETAIAVYAAKVHSSGVALEVTSSAFELMGARATGRRYGFDRRWRDIRTLTLHDPVAYKAREVGEHVLTGAGPQFSLYS